MTLSLASRFTEMPTNNYVESGFWNFDSLFQPQQHPARDAHDTFFVSGRHVTIDLWRQPAVIEANNVNWLILTSV